MKEGQPSATAHLIACSIVFVARDPRFASLVPPQAKVFSEWFMEAYSPRAKLLQRCINNRLFRWSAKVVERLTIPGILLHYVLRKRYLEQLVRTSLGDGFTQVIILGAGFDTLAMRLHQEFAQVRFIEIDHPATQRLKTDVVRNRGMALPNVTFLGVDLTCQTLTHWLLACSDYCPAKPAFFVAEGMLMYFTLEEVRAMLRFICAHAGSGSRLAFTFLEPQAGGAINFKTSSKAVDLWLRLRGEPFRWGISREDLPAFLETQGFSLRELASHETLRARYLTADTVARAHLAQGEHIGVAELLDAKRSS
jgi:methyltransferase (TIGR00027 family)